MINTVETCEAVAPRGRSEHECSVYSCPHPRVASLRVGGGTEEGGVRQASASVVGLCRRHLVAMRDSIQQRLADLLEA